MKKTQQGISLIELILTILVISVGLTGVLALMIQLAKNSVSPQLEWQAIALGDSVLQSLMTCHSTKNQTSSTTPCDLQWIKNSDQLHALDHFEVAVEIESMQTLMPQQAHLVTVIISHPELGKVIFSRIRVAAKNET